MYEEKIIDLIKSKINLASKEVNTKEAEKIRGEGDATATATYADAYNRDPEFYDFTRSLKAYRNTFNDEGDILLLDPDSDYFKYLNKSEPK